MSEVLRGPLGQIVGRGGDAQVLGRVAELLEEAAEQLRRLGGGSSRGGLALVRGGEAECRSSSNQSSVSATSTASPVIPAPMLTAADVAALLQVDARTFRRWRNDQRAKFPKPIQRGRVLRWRRVEVEKWIERRPR